MRPSREAIEAEVHAAMIKAGLAGPDICSPIAQAVEAFMVTRIDELWDRVEALLVDRSWCRVPGAL